MLKNKLKIVSTLLVLVGSDEKDSGLGDDFLDKVITNPKPQVKSETAIKTAKELNPNNKGKETINQDLSISFPTSILGQMCNGF